MEITLQKSKEQALLIELAMAFLSELDIQYLWDAAAETEKQAVQYDTLAVMNRDWNPNGSELLNLQGKAIRSLAEFLTYSQAVTEAKAKVEQHKKGWEQIAETLKLV